jgi:hypothetical protein
MTAELSKLRGGFPYPDLFHEQGACHEKVNRNDSPRLGAQTLILKSIGGMNGGFFPTIAPTLPTTAVTPHPSGCRGIEIGINSRNDSRIDNCYRVR